MKIRRAESRAITVRNLFGGLLIRQDYWTFMKWTPPATTVLTPSRSLREEVIYTPAGCKYKVYIIDEVHMLTIQAFNALLKTLEEPPEHALFILATTEPQKIPQTILSRCQRYDFKRIGSDQIARRLKKVAREEGIEATERMLSSLLPSWETAP